MDRIKNEKEWLSFIRENTCISTPDDNWIKNNYTSPKEYPCLIKAIEYDPDPLHQEVGMGFKDWKFEYIYKEDVSELQIAIGDDEEGDDKP